MWSIVYFVVRDLLRSRWTLVYFIFYLFSGWALLFLTEQTQKALVTLLYITVVLVPLVATLFGSMYYYNVRDFIALLLAQPLPRAKLFIALYLGISLSLTFSYVFGLGLPFLFYGLWHWQSLIDFAILLWVGVLLTFIFTGFAVGVSLWSENRIKGFGIALILWLFFAVLYDGIFLVLLVLFREYPLEKFALIAMAINPIDLGRILILLRLDIAALLGYTGASLKHFLGTTAGAVTAQSLLLFWVVFPLWVIVQIAKRKDF